MSFARPILQSSRQVTIAAAVGQVLFPFPLPLFDPADLTVEIQAGPGQLFQPVTAGLATALTPDMSQGAVTFAQPPRTLAGQAIVVRLTGRRVQSRLGNVTRGGTVSSTWLEDELDRQAIILQELRRDIDTAGAQAAQALLYGQGLAVPAAGVSLWQLAQALVARGEWGAVAAALPVLASGTPAAIAFASRDSLLAPGDQALAWLGALLGDTPAVSAARLGLAATFLPAPGPTAAGFRAALAAAGLYAIVERAIPADPTDPTRIEWDTAAMVPFAGLVASAAAGVASPIALLGALGGIGASPPPLAPAPTASLRQLRTALAGLGLLANAEAAIAAWPADTFALGVGDLASIEWAAGATVVAGDPLASVLGPALGLTAAQTTSLVAYASGIVFS